MEAVQVRPGDRVEPGQTLIVLDDVGADASLRLIEMRAESDLEARSAEAEWKMAVIDHRKVVDAFGRGAAAQFEVDRAQLGADQANLRLLLQQQRREEAALQLAEAREAHSQRTLRAPIGGIVEEIVVEAGETVEALRPVMRLVAIDPLTTEVAAPIGATLAIRVGDPAWIRFADPAGEGSPPPGWLPSRVTSLAQVADAASGTRLVRLETPNPSGHAAGRVVEVVFSAPDGAGPTVGTREGP